LMISFFVVVLKVLIDCVSKGTLAEEYHLV